jgi:hypothetical protein
MVLPYTALTSNGESTKICSTPIWQSTIGLQASLVTSSNYSQVLQRVCNPSDPDLGGIGHPPLLISRLCESMP